MLSLLSGILLWAAWPVSPFTGLIFTGFIPLLWLHQQETKKARFIYSVYLSMLVWNIGTTWWVCNASLPGGIAAMLFSSGFMTLPWIGYRFIYKKLGQSWGFLSLFVFWLTFEYIYLNIQLSWPWLTLGNVFAMHPDWVQWYQYTGSSGGTAWVMIVNILIFKLLYDAVLIKRFAYNKTLWLTCSLLLIPFILSFFIKAFAPASGDGDNVKNVVIIQPNINPYEKFNESTQQEQLEKLLSLSEQSVDTNTALLVWPETAISGVNGFNESSIRYYPSLLPIWIFLEKHPQVSLFTGVEGYKMYTEQDKTSSARKTSQTGQYVDVFNSAVVFYHNSDSGIFYHKSKLVPGVETLPTYLRFLDKWFEQFGGTSGGYASQEERTVMKDKSGVYKIAPAICYESVYGEFITSYIRNGANVISIITNDGWWQNTAGYRQHMQYARLRAIETRRWVIRSANTGISCVIDPYGEVLDPKPWDTAAAIKRKVPVRNDLTFFVLYGDLISRISFGAAGILLIWGIAYRKSPDEKRTHL